MVLATTGPRRVPSATRKNVSDSERAVSAAVGGLFVASGLKKRGVGGLALAFIGAELLRRGITGHCMLYDAIGIRDDAVGYRDDLRSAAATVNARKSIKVEQYEADHAFVNDTRPEVYSKENAELALSRSYAFLKEKLS